MAEEGTGAARLDEARALITRVLAMDPSSTGGHYYAAQLLFTEARWTPERRAEFFAHLAEVKRTVPGFDDRGAYALLARYWLAENEVRNAAAEVKAGYDLTLLDDPSGIGTRFHYAEILSAHRSRKPDRVQVGFQRMFRGCGGTPDDDRVKRWLRRDWGEPLSEWLK